MSRASSRGHTSSGQTCQNIRRSNQSGIGRWPCELSRRGMPWFCRCATNRWPCRDPITIPSQFALRHMSQIHVPQLGTFRPSYRWGPHCFWRSQMKQSTKTASLEFVSAGRDLRIRASVNEPTLSRVPNLERVREAGKFKTAKPVEMLPGPRLSSLRMRWRSTVPPRVSPKLPQRRGFRTWRRLHPRLHPQIARNLASRISR